MTLAFLKTDKIKKIYTNFQQIGSDMFGSYVSYSSYFDAWCTVFYDCEDQLYSIKEKSKNLFNNTELSYYISNLFFFVIDDLEGF